MHYKIDPDRLVIAANEKIKERDYWSNKLSGEVVMSSFPYDYRENDRNNNRNIEVFKFKFNRELDLKLISLSNHSDQTLYVILLAGLMVLLSKYTGSSDIVVGSPILKQDIKRNFINTVLVLRSFIEGGKTFKEILLHVKETVIEAIENRNYPIETLMEQFKKGDASMHFSLFDIGILLQNIHDKSYMEHVNYSMLFLFRRVGETIEGVLEYDSHRYQRTTIRKLNVYLRQLMENLLSNPDITVTELDLVPEEERNQLLNVFNDTAVKFLRNRTIHELFEARVDKNPDNVAVVFKEMHLTYRELNKKSNQLAWVLRKKGATANDVVGILIEDSLEMITSILAILKAGGAYLPLDPAYPKNRIISMLEDCQASILLTESGCLKKHSFSGLQNLRDIKVEPRLTAARPQILDLDGLPLPNRSLVNYDEYNKFIGQALVKHSITLQGSRGCPFNCAYCHRIWPKRHVFRSAENIFEEVQFCYKMGVRRFGFFDDIFNLNRENSMKFFNLILKNRLDVQLFFSNGMRADLLTPDYIDLMVKAGTTHVAFALETASPRLQKLIGKNLHLEKFRENIEYVIEKHPQLITDFFTMHGFPSETKEEAMSTMNFMTNLKWVHFPYVFLLKVYTNTDMEKIALEHGIPWQAIARSEDQALHQLPDTLPFEREFTLKYQMDFFNSYFLSKERLKFVLPYQMKVLTEDEIVQKYDSYLPQDIYNLKELLEFFDIKQEELGVKSCADENAAWVPHLHEKMKKYFPQPAPVKNALRILLLDLSQNFSHQADRFHDLLEPPLALMNLLTYANQEFGSQINGRIAKAKIDFDNYRELKILIEEFQPDVIGIRTLTFYKNFFHHTVAVIRQWGFAGVIITGGPYATSGYASILQDKNVDLVVLGEGEITFVELIRAILENSGTLPHQDRLMQINGLAFVPRQSLQNKKWAREIILLDEMTDVLAKKSIHNPDHINQSGDLAYIIFTSGSSGKPKGVMVEHRALLNLSSWHNRYYRVTEADRATKYAAPGFDASVWEIFPYMIRGSSLYIIPPQIKLDMTKLNEYFEKHHINISFLPTPICELFIREENRSLEKLLTGGDKLSTFIKRNYQLYNNYGPTENAVVTTSCVIDTYYENIPIGKPLDNNRIYILNPDNLQLLPMEVAGELCIAGDSLARGYLNDPETTNKKFIINPHKNNEHIYRTGDLARWLPDGNIEFLGRIDSQVKLRGFRIELAEIQKQIIKMNGIKEAVVIDQTDEAGGKYLCAYIVSAKIYELSEIKKYLSRELPEHMCPSYVVYLQKMPLTANGKIDRKALPVPKINDGEKYAAPENEFQEKLLEIWAEVLAIEKELIGINTSFFELGGHSLKATLMADKILEQFHSKILLADIFKAPTIKEISTAVQEVKNDKKSSIKAVEQREYYALSSAQERMYLIARLNPDMIGYNVPLAVMVEGKLEKEPIERAFSALINRHETLRTSFQVIDRQPVQRIHDQVAFEVEYHDAPGRNENEIVQNFLRPFDLSKPPLFRGSLIRIGDSKYIFIIDMHHIITDGISMIIFVKEFIALYGEKQLYPLKLQYKDFSAWQSSEKEKEAFQHQIKYWERMYEKDIPSLNLPTDFERPAVKNFSGNMVHFIIESRLTREINHLRKKSGTTMYMTLLGVFYVLLFKYTLAEDIVVGSPVTGRRHPHLQNTLGLFVNMLALRNRPQKDQSFREFLGDVKENTLNAMENQDYQFEELTMKLGIQGSLNTNPLFNVVFEMQNIDFEIREESSIRSADPLKVVSYDLDIFSSVFDLILAAVEINNNSAIKMELIYSSELFKKTAVENMTKHYIEILEQVVENDNIKLKDIEFSNRLLKVKRKNIQAVGNEFVF
ncbi:MAG: condensation domain-containing protein [Candidatus Aminicenantes bacterium]|jgi:amino acid adenylation domain-containing protein